MARSTAASVPDASKATSTVSESGTSSGAATSCPAPARSAAVRFRLQAARVAGGRSCRAVRRDGRMSGGLPMAISFLCDTCGRKYRVEDHLAGRQVKCRQCGTSMTVPGTRAGGRRRPRPPGRFPRRCRSRRRPPVPPPPVWTPPRRAPAAGYAPAPQAAWSPPSAPWDRLPASARQPCGREAPPRLEAVGAARRRRRRSSWASACGWRCGSSRRSPSVAGTAGGIATVKVADFPNRPAMRELEPGVMFCDIKHGDTSRAGLRLWLYLPSTSSGAGESPAQIAAVRADRAGGVEPDHRHGPDRRARGRPARAPAVREGGLRGRRVRARRAQAGRAGRRAGPRRCPGDQAVHGRRRRRRQRQGGPRLRPGQGPGGGPEPGLRRGPQLGRHA